MKKVIVLIVTLIIGGLAGYVIGQETKSPGLHAIKPTGKKLTRELEKALVGEDVPVAVAAVITFDGNIQLLSGSHSEHTRVELPLQAKLRAVKPISVIAYEGSTCLLWSDGQSGGGSSYNRYCLIPGL